MKMFESDDFDQVLSQFDFPEVPNAKSGEKENKHENQSLEKLFLRPEPERTQPIISKRVDKVSRFSSTNARTGSEAVIVELSNKVTDKHPIKIAETLCAQNEKENASILSPKHTKRKLINSYFDHQSKRKFPGPAGLLTGALEEPKDESICQLEVLSQDIYCTQHNIQKGLFESPLWNRLQSDCQSWKIHDIDSIKAIKQQALTGNLRRRKAQTVTAFVEAVDRTATDPLVILRDSTGTIKCTLHRDAWSTFSPYIMTEYSALVLQRPTVLTTGSAFKKHYLNITLSNILAIYSSTVVNDDGKILPEGYSVVNEEDFTVIKTEKCSESLGTSLDQTNGADDLFDGLDSIFSDDLF